MAQQSLIRDQLAELTDRPGVYVYRDDEDRVLYVGKAKSLRKRVLSYFQAPLRPDQALDPNAPMAPRSGLHAKVADMVGRIHRLETIVTSGEGEALILEANLVKRHRPPFNIKLRDDKSYPYIGVSLDEAYPRVYFTRERHRRDRRYFGPFSSASKVRETLSVIGKIFPNRPCEGPEPGRSSGIPCLDYHIKRCLAPCIDAISHEDYRALIDQAMDFLSDRQSFFLEGIGGDGPADVLEGFAIEYYSVAMAIPPLLVVPRTIGALPTLAEMLTERRGARVQVRPGRTDRAKLAEMAQRNAEVALDQDQRRHARSREQRREALTELQDWLALPALPVRVECYDISNLGPTHAVASMVVFEAGAPAKAQYRTFTMQYEGGQNDFAHMRETIRRRFTRLADDTNDDLSFGARPGLVVIDGGKGQLGAAIEGLADAGVADQPIVSLAKQREEVFVPGRRDPLLLPEQSPGLRMLQQIRDEAHRFAVRHHRRTRDRAMTTSIFDRLPGVGPARKKAILRHFGSPDRFVSATRDELEAVPGLPPKVAREIWDHLHRAPDPEDVPSLTRTRRR